MKQLFIVFILFLLFPSLVFANDFSIFENKRFTLKLSTFNDSVTRMDVTKTNYAGLGAKGEYDLHVNMSSIVGYELCYSLIESENKDMELLAGLSYSKRDLPNMDISSTLGGGLRLTQKTLILMMENLKLNHYFFSFACLIPNCIREHLTFMAV